MMKYSFIVPVYNTKKYLKKCLDSILNQTYQNYEIIVVNNGSTDESANILKEYEKNNNNIKVISQENQGLSEARNNGIQKATGDYFLLVDSDDYIEENLLEKLNEVIFDEPDLIRFQAREVDEEYKIIKEYEEEDFNTLDGKSAFKKISNYHYIENAWIYLYKTAYFKNNKFKYTKGVYHEDYGLTPLVIIKANKVKSISYIGYNYLQQQNSIMHSNNYNKVKKKAFDMLHEYIKLIDLDDDKIYKSFLTNSVIQKAKTLKGVEYKEYINKLKKIKAFDCLLDDTLLRKIKKYIIKHNLKLYLNLKK